MATYLNDRGFSFVWQKYILCRQSEMILSGVNKETENTNNNVLDSGEMLRSLSRRLNLCCIF